MKALSFFGLGVLFAIGLGLSGMTQPTKVIGFLDVAGQWDPALLFVMGSAVMVTFVGYRWVLRRPMPVLAGRFDIPTVKQIDPSLLAGATLFGLGWGLAGFCPGPAIVALASGSIDVMIFVAAMFIGFLIKDVVIKPASVDAGLTKST